MWLTHARRNNEEWQGMNETATTWAIVLAAGDGRRLHGLTTTDAGVAVPKQYCSLRGGASLLRHAMLRAESIARPDHVCAVVAAAHRQWWEPALQSGGRVEIVAQPRNRGTALGILLPLLRIVQRDPRARVVILPADHHVDDEALLTQVLRRTVGRLQRRVREILLLGIEPDEADPDLGYIVPGAEIARQLFSVARFVEKPSAALARRLLDRGALWNAFIVAARANTLLALFQARCPHVVACMRAALDQDAAAQNRDAAAPAPQPGASLTALYEILADIDFSKQVLEGAEPALRLVPVPGCGWSDLGTPGRLADTLRRHPQPGPGNAELPGAMAGLLNLAVQHARQGGAALLTRERDSLS